MPSKVWNEICSKNAHCTSIHADHLCSLDNVLLQSKQAFNEGHVMKARNKIRWRMQVAKNSEVIFLAVKPQYVATVLKEIKQHLTDQHIVVSIAAGIPLAAMKVGAILFL